MQNEEFRKYLNELDTLSREIRQSPEFTIGPNPLPREEVLRRFELNRALVNLLHLATVHMVRSDASDYDAGSEQWMLGSVHTAASHIRQDLRNQPSADIRDLSTRALTLVDRMLSDLEAVGLPVATTDSEPLIQSA